MQRGVPVRCPEAPKRCGAREKMASSPSLDYCAVHTSGSMGRAQAGRAGKRKRGEITRRENGRTWRRGTQFGPEAPAWTLCVNAVSHTATIVLYAPLSPRAKATGSMMLILPEIHSRFSASQTLNRKDERQAGEQVITGRSSDDDDDNRSIERKKMFDGRDMEGNKHGHIDGPIDWCKLLFTDPQFSNPFRRAIKSACCRSWTPRSLTRNELVKTCGREPNPAAATVGVEDEATTTKTTLKLASSAVQKDRRDVPALQEREAALNMARFRKTSRPCSIPFFFLSLFRAAAPLDSRGGLSLFLAKGFQIGDRRLVARCREA